MIRAKGPLGFLVLCTALGAPVLAHAAPRMGWQIGTLPHPMTLLIALGQSDPAGRRGQASPLPVAPHIAPPLGPGATVTGWTRPLGVRLALRW